MAYCASRSFWSAKEQFGHIGSVVPVSAIWASCVSGRRASWASVSFCFVFFMVVRQSSPYLILVHCVYPSGRSGVFRLKLVVRNSVACLLRCRAELNRSPGGRRPFDRSLAMIVIKLLSCAHSREHW